MKTSQSDTSSKKNKRAAPHLKVWPYRFSDYRQINLNRIKWSPGRALRPSRLPLDVRLLLVETWWRCPVLLWGSQGNFITNKCSWCLYVRGLQCCVCHRPSTSAGCVPRLSHGNLIYSDCGAKLSLANPLSRRRSILRSSRLSPNFPSFQVLLFLLAASVCCSYAQLFANEGWAFFKLLLSLFHHGFGSWSPR